MAERLAWAREQRGLKPPAAAEALGIPRSTYYQHENGTRGFKRAEAIRYAQFFGVSLEWLLTGKGQPAKTGAAISSAGAGALPVSGVAQAGIWREDDAQADTEASETVPVVAHPRFAQARNYALRVVGPSMNKLIADGEYALCVDALDAGYVPRDGDIVVAVRRRAQSGVTETTLKQFVMNGRRAELWPRSTDPKFQKPLTLGEGGAEEVQIIGLAWGRYAPL